MKNLYIIPFYNLIKRQKKKNTKLPPKKLLVKQNTGKKNITKYPLIMP